MTKGDIHTLFNVFFTFANFWVMGKLAKQHKMEGLDGFQVQVAPKLHTASCRADKGGWNKGWASVHTSSSRAGANQYLKSLKRRYRGDRCVKFRITGN